MATLIDRDKCQERIFRFADRLADWGYPEQAKAVRAVAKGIKLEKTVDAVPVVHSRWEEWWPGISLIMTGEEMLHMCSSCGAKYADIEGYKHCPNCGAHMDLEVKDA